MTFKSGTPFTKSIIIPDEGEPAKPSIVCPYCGAKTTLTPIRWTLDKWIGRCDGCNKELYADVKYRSAIRSTMYFDVLETYPKYSPPMEESIPKDVWEDYSEAYQCFNVEAYKATVVMCRRVVQNAAMEKGATKKDTHGKWIPLTKQIETAFPGAEFQLLREIAGDIKFFGDYGAHPSDDGIDQVSDEEAKEILDFTESILDYVYVQPDKIKKIRERKKP